MRKLKIFVFGIIFIVIFILIGLFFIGYFRPKGAGLNVYANQESSVFVDGELVGKTPFQKTMPSGDIVLKLVPVSGKTQFETKLSLTPGVETMIRRDFDENSFDSAGEAVSFEKTFTKEASFVVVSVPDKSQISVDGSILGFAPYKIDDISAGEHDVLISSPGYVDRAFTIKTYVGYKLTAVVELKKAPEVQAAIAPPSKRVQILTTPNGFLRVRENASTQSAELFQVQPGMSFNYKDETGDWIEIEYSTGLFGWISSQYAEVIEN